MNNASKGYIVCLLGIMWAIGFVLCLNDEEGKTLQAMSDEIAMKEQNTATSASKEELNSAKEESGTVSEGELADRTERNIRVLLCNPESGGIYYDELEICRTEKEEAQEEELWRLCVDDRRGFLESFDAGSKELTVWYGDEKKGSYQGKLLIYEDENGLFVVNELPVEDYLRKVVPSEMPSGYPMEALKAQAVCARSYAYYAIRKPRYEAYYADLTDDVNSQVYGIIDATDATDEAIRETAGTVMTLGGELFEPYYYACSCGISNDLSVWGAKESEVYEVQSLNELHQALDLSKNEEFAGYLANFHDDYEENEIFYRWETAWTMADSNNMMERCQSRAQIVPWDFLFEKGTTEPGKLTDIQIIKRAKSGCAIQIKLVFERETVEVSGEYNIRYVLCEKETQVLLQSGETQLRSSVLPSAFLTIEVKNEPEGAISYKVVGGGNGHGIGMSQNGAKALSEKGFDYSVILRYYYCNIEMKDLEDVSLNRIIQ